MTMHRIPSYPETFDPDLYWDDESVFMAAREDYDASVHQCQFCGSFGLVIASSYRRKIITVVDGMRAEKYVYVPCVYCEGCGGYYHALLFDILIPFSSYTMLFVLTVLDAYFNRTCRAIDVCVEWEISQNTLYSWKKRFIDHYNSWVNDSFRKIPVVLENPKNPKIPHTPAKDEVEQTSHWRYYQLMNRKATEALTHVRSVPAFAKDFFDRVRIFSFMQPNHATHLKPLPVKRRC